MATKRKRRARWEGDILSGDITMVLEREPGTGTIDTVTIGGRSYVRHRLWVTNAKGVRERKQVYGRTHSEVERKVRNLLKDPSGTSDAKRLTLAKHLEAWLTFKKANKWRVSTSKSYTHTANKYIIPRIGTVKLANLTPTNVKALLLELENEDVGARTRQNVHKVLRAAVQDAVREGLLVVNPVAAVQAPTSPNRAREDQKQILTIAQAAKLLAVMEKDDDLRRYVPLFHVAIATGMRSGELLGLEWASVKLPQSTLRVEQALTHDEEGRAVLTAPKTASSTRTVQLDPETVRMFRRQRDQQKTDGYKGTMVFTGSNGGLLSRHNIRNRVLQPALVKAKLSETVTFHSLRHVMNTALAAQGVSLKTLQERLGHSTSRTTLDVYTHPAEEAAKSAARQAGILLKRERVKNGVNRPQRRKPGKAKTR